MTVGSEPQTRPYAHAAVTPPRGPRRLVLSLRREIGRYLSIRSKLTIYYGLMVLLTLTLAGGTIYWFVDRQLSSQIDQGLIASGAQLANRLHGMAPPPPCLAGNASGSSGSACANSPAVRRYVRANASQLQGQCAQKYLGFGRNTSPLVWAFCISAQSVLNHQLVLASQPGVVGGILFEANYAIPGFEGQPGPFVRICPDNTACDALFPINMETLGSISTGLSPPQFNTNSLRGLEVRTYVRALPEPHWLRGSVTAPVLFIYENERPYQDVRHTIVLTLLLGVPLGVIIALAAGFWIARAALRPIGRISRTVRSIGESKDLSRRIDFVGPQDEVGRLAETFDNMMDRIEAVFETQRRFIADASHELRTPLTAIRGNADLLRIAPENEREECVTVIRKEANRMSRLVNDLLLLAEAEAGQGHVHLQPVALDDVFLDVYQSARSLAEGKVNLVLEAADQVTVDGDADRLKQLMLNLVDNAVKFTPRGGTVSIGLTRDGENARMAVSDSGVGIPPEEQEAIFRRFYRVETSRSLRGSGLGLSIVSWIVQEHGGQIELSSAPDKGTTFTVLLPVRRATGVAGD